MLQQCCHSQDWIKGGGQILWNAMAFCEMSKSSWQMGKLRMKEDLENHSKAQQIPSGAMVEYHPSSPKDQARIHQVGKKILPGIFLGYELVAGGIWKGDVLIADLEDLEKLDPSNIYPRRINAKEVLIRQKDDEFIFPFAEGTAQLRGTDYEFRESTRRREPPVNTEDLNGKLQGEPGESQPTESTDDAEARADFWSIQGDFIYRHHNELRVQLY